MYDKCQALASFRWSHLFFKNHVSWCKLFHQIYLVCFFSSLCCAVSCMKPLLFQTFATHKCRKRYMANKSLFLFFHALVCFVCLLFMALIRTVELILFVILTMWEYHILHFVFILQHVHVFNYWILIKMDVYLLFSWTILSLLM